MKRNSILLLLLFCNSLVAMSQDPHFSQYFMAPQLINPAMVGSGEGDWRVMCNWRQQWGDAGTPFNTQSLQFEYKLLGKGDDEKNKVNTLAIGGGLMLDQSMYGGLKSTYGLASIAYHAKLSSTQTMGIGFQGMYGDRTIDYSRLTFGEQFTSGGFDQTLPSGESALSNMKSFFSLSSGLFYNFNNDNINVDLGAAAYNINKPKQTALNDPQEELPTRYVAHAGAALYVSDKLSFNFNGFYQTQALQEYFSLGGALGWDVNPQGTSTIFLGGWYRNEDSFYPYLGWLINNVQVGFSYDITTSKQNSGPVNPKSIEFSLVIKQKNDSEKKLGVSCPNSLR